MNKLLFEKGVGKVNFDFGMLEMKSAKECEARLARRRRRSIISNSQALLKKLAKYQAGGRHQHVTTREWTTTAYQMYNNEFCKTVCETCRVDWIQPARTWMSNRISFAEFLNNGSPS